MVMDEILKTIQDSRGELDVPPLSYPPLQLSSGGTGNVGSSSVNLEELSHRMHSIAALTQSAETLIKEAQHLQAKGQSAAAKEVIEQVQILKSMVARLANAK